MSKLLGKYFRILKTLLNLFTKGRINDTTSAALLFWRKFSFDVFLEPLLHLRCFVVQLPVHQAFSSVTEESLNIISNRPEKLLRDLCSHVIVNFMTINFERFLLTHALPALKPVDRF